MNILSENKTPCIMDYRPLLASPTGPDAVIKFSCGCWAYWNGSEWKPECQYPSIICVEPSHDHDG